MGFDQIQKHLTKDEENNPPFGIDSIVVDRAEANPPGTKNI